MAKSGFKIEVDDSRVKELFRTLPRNIQASAIKSAARKVLRKNTQSRIRGLLTQRDNYPSLEYLARGIKVRNARSRENPGAVISYSGPDIPVGQGNNRRFWTGWKYLILVFRGNYKKPNRYTTSGKESRGNVRGIFNGRSVFTMVWNQTNGTMRQQFKEELVKVIDRTIKRLGRKQGVL